MKLFKNLTSVEDYAELVLYLIESDQPNFIYRRDEDQCILVSDVEIDDIDTKINELADEIDKDKKPANETLIEGFSEDDWEELGDYFLGL